MNPNIEMKIERDVKEELKEIEHINLNIEMIRDKLLEKTPSHFSKRDIINAIFGSLMLGTTFILKGQTIQVASILTPYHILAIVGFTLLVLMGEIYFVGYTRVKNKNQRAFGQFMTKRLFTLYFITVVVSFFLVYLFNINHHPLIVEDVNLNVMKIVALMAFPCAVGAAIPSLLKKY